MAWLETPGVRKRVIYDGRPNQEAAMWQAFWERGKRRGRAWEGCEACPPERRDPGADTDIHHIIPQAELKQYARDHRLSGLARLRLLTDARNSIVVCKTCHDGDISRLHPINRRTIHEDAWAFARELGMEDYVKDRYPT